MTSPNTNPTPEELDAKLPEFREMFKTKLADDMDKFDSRDVEKFNTNDAYARSFLSFQTRPLEEVDKAVDTLKASLIFRKEWGINDLTDETFSSSEAVGKDGLYYKGHDKDNIPILYFNIKFNQAKTAEDYVILKKYIAYMVNDYYKDHPGDTCVCFLDMSGAGTRNISVDISKFIISCFTTYFPGYLAYMVNYDMPWLVSGIWKIISAFLSAEQKKKVIMLKKKDLKDYIPEAGTWWEHMK